jgi:hypothetical protein
MYVGTVAEAAALTVLLRVEIGVGQDWEKPIKKAWTINLYVLISSIEEFIRAHSFIYPRR